MVLCWVLLGVSCASAAPWWDGAPLMVRQATPEVAERLGATVSLCGVGDDPCWGLYAQRVRIVSVSNRVRDLHAAGINALCWLEGFGTTQCYIAQLGRDEHGGWVKYSGAPDVTRVFHNHWSWHVYPGGGELRWLGPVDFVEDVEYARPFTRSHPRYSCPPPRYPDGSMALGWRGPANDPRNHRLWEATCGKDVFGNVHFSYGFNEKVNAIDPATGRLHGPTVGLLKVGDRYAGTVAAMKDSACPFWIDYLRASITQALDAGVDGAWVDNFSAWDSFGNPPMAKAFGEWSVTTFRDHLRAHFSLEQRQAMGVEPLASFDVRAYLREKCREFGGAPEAVKIDDSRDPWQQSRRAWRDAAWRDRRWLDDPVWRSYLIHKRRTGAHALQRYYETLKRVGAENGKPDFLVAGNDIPAYSLGWVRGQLDMVSTELSWGWGLASGRRGFMPPPHGSFVPFYRLAREHAGSRWVNAWQYVPEKSRNRPNIARVLYYQGLANGALPCPNAHGGRSVGTRETTSGFFRFVRKVAPLFAERKLFQRVGVYFSSSSQLMTIAPGGFIDHDDQTHVFAHWGWGTALESLHVPYRALPEWKLTKEELAGLEVLIIPSATVFPRGDAAAVREWVAGGGKLIVSGTCGVRDGEEGNFESRQKPALTDLVGSSPSPFQARRLGRGRICVLREAVGKRFFQADEERAALLPIFRRALDAVELSADGRVFLEGTTAPATIGLTPYADAGRRRLFIDVYNVDIDLAADSIRSLPSMALVVSLPHWLRGASLGVQVLSPNEETAASVRMVTSGTAQIQVARLEVFASLLLTPTAGSPVSAR